MTSSKEDNGNTNLHKHVLRYSDIDCLKRISSSHMSINIYAKNDYGDTALKIAVERNLYKTVEYLLKTTYLKDRDIDPELDLIHVAARHNYFQIISTFLKYQIWNPNSYNCSNFFGLTPLMIAAAFDNLEAFMVLFESGMTSFYKRSYMYINNRSMNAFVAAILSGSSRIIEYVVQKDFSEIRDACMDYGSNLHTPLHTVAATGNVKIFKLIIYYFYQNVNPLNENLETPLKIAIENDSIEIVELLMHYGATKALSIDDRKTLLSCVCQQKNVETLKLFWDDLKMHSFHRREYYDILQYAFIRAIRENFDEGVEFFLNQNDWKNIIRFQWEKNFDGEDNAESPMQILIKSMPKMAQIVLDQCVNNSIKINNETFIDFDYDFIDDRYYLPIKEGYQGEVMYEGQKYDKYYQNNKDLEKIFGPPPRRVTKVIKDIRIAGDDPDRIFERTTFNLKYGAECREKNFEKYVANCPLTIMLKNNRCDLLSHELVQSYISNKWNQKYIKVPIYLSCAFYFIFAAVLSFIILIIPQNEMILTISKTNSNLTETVFESKQCFLTPILKLTIIFFGIVHFFVSSYKLFKMFDFLECFFNIIIFGLISATLFCINYIFELNFLLTLNFCVWILFINSAKRIPRIGVPIFMIFNTLKLLIQFSPAISTFAIPFIIAYFVHPKFSNNNYPMNTLFALIFIIFAIFLMSIFIGLVVADVKANLKKAEFLRTKLQIETINFIETLMSEKMRRNIWRGYCRVAQNKTESKIDRIRALFRWFGSTKKAMNKITNNYNNSSETETVMLVDLEKKLERNCNSLKMKQENLIENNEKVEERTKTFAQFQNFQNEGNFKRKNSDSI